MNIEHFIAKRIAFTDSKTFTKVIVRIAIAAIAVSVTVMILTTAIIAGFKKEITEKIFGFWGHIHITDTNISRNFELTPIHDNEKFYNDIRNIAQVDYEVPVTFMGYEWDEKLRSKTTYGGVKGLYPYIIIPGVLSTKENFHGVLLKGVGQDYNWDRLNEFIIDGHKVQFHRDSISDDLLISKNIADKMSIKTGNKVILSFIRDNEQFKKRFTVCGIYNTGLEEYDKRFGLVDIRKVQDILQWDRTEVQGMEVVLDDVRDLDVITDYIYYDVLPQKFYAESIRSKFPGIFEWLKLQDINETVIKQLMIIVAIINMITVLLILILERTRMIGILKSLGMHNGNVRKIFLWHAGYIIAFGLLLGNLIGIGIGLLQQHFKFIKLDEANYYLDTAPIAFNWWSVLIINVATLVITLVFLTLPTMIITRITPVKTLRFE
ncbi:MAG: ABC transporter permease [Saprospiraceae bacterium]|nr:MAG: lipoprotein release ABC transporter permease [Bacteroidetes bacterium OLB9]MCO6464262.1 ABC transporter permease [Saprospiraceae bacterium]